MTKAETKDRERKYCEFELIVGNFSINLRSNHGESIDKLSVLGINIYNHVLHLNNLNDDPGVR